ncbi:MAG: L-threonylcarbamoyladenylate synthase, partial [Rhodobiaceae bacterium]|nr:L-threonylcarbamoyladenylate synthase [Rhodobiaceae bacterium]
WPGPLTLVVPRRTGTGRVCDLACAGLDTVGLRVPAAPFLAEAIARFGRPLAGPSANRSGKISPTTAAAVMEDLSGRIELVIDGGDTPVGIESTIIACIDGTVRLLRPGGIPAEDIIAVTGPDLVEAGKGEQPVAPGMLSSHYAPDAPLRLNARRVLAGEALLAFGPHLPEDHEIAVEILNLSPRGDLTRAASRLYRHLRALDRFRPVAIAVSPIPETGLGAAIADRLRRAAAPRTPPEQDFHADDGSQRIDMDH